MAASPQELTMDQRETISLLSMATFFEYFGLMLYVHMSVLLNGLFFAKYDPHTTNLVTAFAFCSTFVFQPCGAWLFGWIGDNIGRKITIILSILLMLVSCLVIAAMPTYAQIGITASVAIIICRILQGMSSIGQTIGTRVFICETIMTPTSYRVVALIGAFSALGTIAAMGISFLAVSPLFNWRVAFLFSAGIALIAFVARTTLKETPEFVNAKQQIKSGFKNVNEDVKIAKNNSNIIDRQKINKITALSLFLMDCMYPVCFYIGYVYCGHILQSSFSYSPEQVIHQNFFVSITELVSFFVLIYLSYKVHPLKIIKKLSAIFFIFVLVCPYLLYNLATPFDLLIVQSFIIFFGPTIMIALPILFRHFPVFKRFTSISLIHALSRAIIYAITSFGLIYLTEYLGHYGLLIILIPTSIGFILGLRHFEKLENEKVAE